MLQVTNLVGFGAAASAAPSAVAVTYLGSEAYGSSATTHTFSANALSGTHVAVAVSWRGSAARTLSSATIGGGSAVIACQVNESSGFTGAAIIIATRGTGNNIALTFSGAVATWMGVHIWAIDGLASTTASATSTQAATHPAVSLSSPAGGVTFLAMATTSDAPGTVDGDIPLDHEAAPASDHYAGGHLVTTSIQTLSADQYDGPTNHGALAAASFL